MRNPTHPLLAAIVSFCVGSGVCCLIPNVSQFAFADDQSYAGTNAAPLTGDWAQWGGSSERNNVPVATNLPEEWNVGSFDRDTGRWKKDEAEHVKWVADLGSQSYGNPVVADGQVYVGTNNGRGYLARYPGDIDLGCLLAFSTSDGSFLWQHSSEKLITGRVHDWPLQGICCAPLVEGNRLWYVTSRGTVVCLDTAGFHDGEDDGPETGGLARLFSEPPTISQGLDDGQLPAALVALIESQTAKKIGSSFRVETIKPGSEWQLSIRMGREKQFYGLRLADGQLVISDKGLGSEPGEAKELATVATDLTSGLATGKVGTALRGLLAARGLKLTDQAACAADGARAWKISDVIDGVTRDVVVRFEGPNLSAYKRLIVADKDEADVIWTFDMMGELDVSQHNMCSCSVTTLGDILFVNTSNGVDESHKNIPSVRAPSFMALDKTTGEVLWTDGSPGENILHGQWSSPTVGVLGGVPQVIFGGGDGWVYSFQADRGQGGRPTLLWKFDANPKDSKWVLGGRGTRNNIIATPVIYKDRVYVAVGQDPEHGPGNGHLWCIDPTRRGDVSPQLVVRVDDRTKIVPHRRLQAVDPTAGEVAIDNKNSAAIWHYSGFDQDGDGEIGMEETMNRSCGTVAIKDDVLYIADFSGIFHCLDALTGKVYWTYDMLAQAWGSPLIADNKVYIGDEDGEVAVFSLSTEPQEPMHEIDMMNSVYSTPIVSHNVMYIANKTHLFAIQKSDAKN